jgi:hypothetical protein
LYAGKVVRNQIPSVALTSDSHQLDTDIKGPKHRKRSTNSTSRRGGNLRGDLTQRSTKWAHPICDKHTASLFAAQQKPGTGARLNSER